MDLAMSHPRKKTLCSLLKSLFVVLEKEFLAS